jgi:hypothetical protein
MILGIVGRGFGFLAIGSGQPARRRLQALLEQVADTVQCLMVTWSLAHVHDVAAVGKLAFVALKRKMNCSSLVFANFLPLSGQTWQITTGPT